jgi:putative transposase
VNGERDILGLWVGDGSESAKFWLQILTELKNRGVADVCIAVCDGLKGLPDAINTVWELTTVQACIIHLIRNPSATPRGSTGTGSPTTCGRSTPPPPRPKQGRGSRSSPRSGASPTRLSHGSGRTPGPSSCRSWTTTSRSARSSARRMKLSRSCSDVGVQITRSCGCSHREVPPPPAISAGAQARSRCSAPLDERS